MRPNKTQHKTDIFLFCFASRDSSRINIALARNGGTCTASDEVTPCDLAIDGREDPQTSSWLAAREKPQSWIRIDFTATATVDAVEILQHCSDIDKAKTILLEFSDGSNDMVSNKQNEMANLLFSLAAS